MTAGWSVFWYDDGEIDGVVLVGLQNASGIFDGNPVGDDCVWAGGGKIGGITVADDAIGCNFDDVGEIFGSVDGITNNNTALIGMSGLQGKTLTHRKN